MSAILSAEALNDFIAPSVACIKPIESLPPPPPSGEVLVLRDGEGPPADARTAAQISLTDCLACSGCVTSSEAVLVQMQSHNEVLDALQKHPNKKFVAVLSPQTRAALGMALGIGSIEAGNMVMRLLTQELKGHKFDFIVDTNAFRHISLEYAAAEVVDALQTPADDKHKKPVLASSCPGFICYLESTHPELIPHLSALKSPQAIAGTFLKALLIGEGVVSSPDDIYVVSIMPCFDKKLEGARAELTSAIWRPDDASEPSRDVDCVITTRELLSLADAQEIAFPTLARTPLPAPAISASPALNSFLTTPCPSNGTPEAGSSGGNLLHILSTLLTAHPSSTVSLQPGRNVDTLDYVVSADGKPIAKLSRCYGFRNIQNLVRRLKPAKPKRIMPQFGKQKAAPAPVVVRAPLRRECDVAAYVEVMACPGGCTNGGGQIKWNDDSVWKELAMVPAPANHKELLAKVDEAYYSDGGEDFGEPIHLARPDEARLQNVARRHYDVMQVVQEWGRITGIDERKLVTTTYRKVANDIGKKFDPSEALQKVSGDTGGW